MSEEVCRNGYEDDLYYPMKRKKGPSSYPFYKRARKGIKEINEDPMLYREGTGN